MSETYFSALTKAFSAFPGLIFELKETAESTNQTVKTGMKESPGKRMICVCQTQTGGRGRLGRKWHSSGDNIYVSFGYPCFWPAKKNSEIPLLAAVALNRALQTFGVNGKIKWPNDILTGGKKIAGILCESITTGNEAKGVIIGIGLNVNQTEFDSEISETAASMKQVLGKEMEKAAVLLEIKKQMDQVMESFPKCRFADCRPEYERNSCCLGEWMTTVTDENVEGRCIGFSDEGAILLQNDKGITVKIRSGEVTGKTRIRN